MLQFTVKDLTPAAPLESVAGNNNTFRIVFYSCEDFSEFNVMSVETSEEEYFHLRECIWDIAQDSEAKLNRTPEDNEIVLVPGTKGKGQYHRAVVQSVKTDSDGRFGKVGVYLFDVGGHSLVSVKDLKPVTEEIVSFPVMSYQIIPEGLEDLGNYDNVNQKILVRDFKQLMKSLGTTTYNISKVKGIQQEKISVAGPVESTDVFQKYKVVLSSNNKSKIEIGKMILELGVWQWERLLGTSTGTRWTDELVCTQMLQSSKFNGELKQVYDQMYLPDVGIKFSAQVTRVMPKSPLETNEAHITTILLDSPLYRNYHVVLHNQIKLYCEAVEKSLHNPRTAHYSIVKFDDDEECREFGINPLETWCRALKITSSSESAWIKLVDWDESVLLNKVDSASFELRQLPVEFQTVPLLSVQLCPIENGAPISFERAQAIFEPTHRYSFKTVGSWKDTMRKVELVIDNKIELH